MNNIDQKYQALFTPWKIGNVEIKNRIVMCPMGGTSLFGWFELTVIFSNSINHLQTILLHEQVQRKDFICI